MIEWKDIQGYEQLYMVSNTGIVKSLPRFGTIGVTLKQHLNDSGYLVVVLYKNSKRKEIRVHRLVAIAFIPNPENKPEVNHKDGDKLNNNDWNLEWNTHKENMHHAVKHGIGGAIKKINYENDSTSLQMSYL